jgi:hypothetical protein
MFLDGNGGKCGGVGEQWQGWSHTLEDALAGL